jgi:hypothetical protein
MTPRKFFALVEQHNRAEGGEESGKGANQPSLLTPEELLSWK